VTDPAPRSRRVLAVGALCAALAGALVGAARVGLIGWHGVRPWYSEEIRTHLGPALDEAHVRRPRVSCSEITVLVLDDHPVARLVAAGLATDLAAAIGAAVMVRNVSTAAFAPGDVERSDVLALVDLVHFDAEDWLVYQRCQVRLNVALGRPPRAVHDGRGTVRRVGEVLDLDTSFALEYSVDGHWEVMGLAEQSAHFAASASSIVAGVAQLVDAVEWVRADSGEHADAAPAREFPPLVPAGDRQWIYDVVRPSGAREVLLQVTTERDWTAELERLEATALALGWRPEVRTLAPDGRPRALVLVCADERLELALAYMQGTLRSAGEQRQVLTLLHRSAPR
jgi:hypothetical protein